MPTVPRRKPVREIESGMHYQYIGIDPGLSGGVVFLYEDCDEFEFHRMPRDMAELFVILAHQPECVRHVYVEKLASRPDQSAVAMWTFALHYGSLLMAAAVNFPQRHTLVSPKQWQHPLGVRSKKGEKKTTHKARLLNKARELYPYAHNLWRTADRTTQLAVCDALLLAHAAKVDKKGQLHAEA